ncbi:hypothetical protein [Roseburia faecis]|nr:hypothetical protein [Roseburia faecis]
MDICKKVDASFYSGSDFVSAIPFFSSTSGFGISTKILSQIDVDHPTA